MVFTHDLDLGDSMGTNYFNINSGCVLFVLPQADDYTTTERILTTHCTLMIILILIATDILSNLLSILV